MPANQKVGEELPDAERCTRIKKDGERCNRRRWADTGLCYSHTPAANRKRSTARAKDIEVRAAMNRYGIAPVEDGPLMTGQAQLSIELRRTVAWIAFCEAQLQKLDSEADFVYGLAGREHSSKVGVGSDAKGNPVDINEATSVERYEARQNAWVEKLDWNRAHMLRISKLWIDAGYEAARLELERQTVEMFFASMNRAIVMLGHDIEDPKVMEVINAAISGVAQPAAISA